MTAEVSHGRGGAGNFNTDDTQYVDGSVVRVGVEGSHGDGVYSAGRGGAGNISDVGKPTGDRRDEIQIPDEAVRASQDQEYHTGRGGAGNEFTAVDHEKKAAAKARQEGAPMGIADKLKNKLFGGMKK